MLALLDLHIEPKKETLQLDTGVILQPQYAGLVKTNRFHKIEPFFSMNHPNPERKSNPYKKKLNV